MRRRIELEGCLNFRDLGGYPAEGGMRVRWRQLFRSDALHRLTRADVEHLRGGLGIGDIIDLRSSYELDLDGRGPLGREPIRFHHLPLFDGRGGAGAPLPAPTLADMYLGLAERAKAAIARVVDTLAATDAPAVYHCAAGKDRTGVISAVLLGLLGVREEIIAADYAATQETLDAIVERLAASRGYERIWEELPPDTLHAAPETMLSLLSGLRERYGSLRDYARAAGVPDASIERLRGRLLEQA